MNISVNPSLTPVVQAKRRSKLIAPMIDKPRRPLRSLLLGIIAIQFVSYLLYVFFNWMENDTLKNNPFGSESQRFAEQASAYAFWSYCLCWCAGILLTTMVYLYVRRGDDPELRDAASRDVIGYLFFPLFIAVVAYLPVYLAIDGLMALVKYLGSE